MKAYILSDINNFKMKAIPCPEPCRDEVLVKVMTVGICGSDIPRIYETGAHVHPLIPGHEFAGIVEKVGADVDTSWMGRRVGVFPLIPCEECDQCREKHYEMCKKYSYLGSRRDGGFAEYVSVPEKNLIELPDNVSFEEGAMLEPMAVAVHAVRRISPLKEDTVAVCGLGTIGLLLVMFLRDFGIDNILVIGNKEVQRQKICDIGIDEENYCDSRNNDVSQWIMEKTGEKGVNVFFECVGSNATVASAINSTAPLGKVMLVGNPHSDMELDKNIYWKILRNQLTVMGSWNSSFTKQDSDDWNYVIERLSKNAVSPKSLITHNFSLDDLYRGCELMKNKSEEYIKVMIRN